MSFVPEWYLCLRFRRDHFPEWDGVQDSLVLLDTKAKQKKASRLRIFEGAVSYQPSAVSEGLKLVAES
jgi:hypothetical protein